MTDTSAELEMLAHIRATVSPDTEYRSRLLDDLKSIHIVTPDDDKIEAELDLLVASILAGSSVAYALTITGKSGAGKSASLNRCLNAHPSFAPFEGRYNRLSLSLRATTPPSTTLKTLGKELLQVSGYEAALAGDEDDNWRTLIRRMKIMQTKVLVLDEFQHVLDAPTSKKYMHLSNSIKNLTQEAGWPIWLIICGIPEIRDFISRDLSGQLDRRAPIIEFENLADVKEDRDRVEDTIYVLAESCKLELGFALTKDFVLRLMHGGIWRFGTTVHIIKNAIEKALWDKSWSRTGGGLLTAEHFAQGYRRLARNCPDETNVLDLRNKDWHLVQREVDGSGQLADPASRRGRRRSSK